MTSFSLKHTAFTISQQTLKGGKAFLEKRMTYISPSREMWDNFFHEFFLLYLKYQNQTLLKYAINQPNQTHATPPLEILTIACLTFTLLLTDRPILGLPEYKLKVVNICKMHGTGGLEVVVL